MSDCETQPPRLIGFITNHDVGMDKCGYVSMDFHLTLPSLGTAVPVSLFEKDVDVLLTAAGVKGPEDYHRLERLPCFYQPPAVAGGDCRVEVIRF